VIQLLEHHGTELLVSEKFARYFKSKKFKVFTSSKQLRGTQYFISLGGDGTLLESITLIGRQEIPIMGINTGRLGFLSTTSREETEEAIQSLFKGKVKTSSRTLLRLTSHPKLFGEMPFALNDFTITKKDNTMVRIGVYVNGELLNAYFADGLIVSTPTGSTGYSLSCGGPIVHPKSQSIIITPVSPHNLTARPIVLSDKVELEFRVESRSKKFQVSLDSRSETIDDSWTLKIRRAPFKVKLLQVPNHDYFNTLRQKLNWGLDVRN
jgi:NAD+ kinase